MMSLQRDLAVQRAVIDPDDLVLQPSEAAAVARLMFIEDEVEAAARVMLID